MNKTVYILALVFVFGCFAAYASDWFDEYGVWHPIEGTTLSAGERVSAGPIDVTHSDEVLNFLLADSVSDSLLLKLDVYGMMSSSAADTVNGVLIGSKEEYTGDGTIVFSDTLTDDDSFPFIFIKVTNSHADSSAVVDLYGFSRPIQHTVLQLR